MTTDDQRSEVIRAMAQGMEDLIAGQVRLGESVQELADGQRLIVTAIQELAQAQARTDAVIRELADTQQQLASTQQSIIKVASLLQVDVATLIERG